MQRQRPLAPLPPPPPPTIPISILRRGDFNTFLEYKPRGGVIADSTGMGKTASVIGLALTEPASDGIGPNLIITPSHLFGQWKQEILKFAGGVVRVLEGISGWGPLRG